MHVVIATNTGGCGGLFIAIDADFEPPHQPGETGLLCAVSEQQVPVEYMAALEQGIRVQCNDFGDGSWSDIRVFRR
ncbi:hypothetical protein [Nocardia sp. NPDC051570]|uniref:hypothetical protein n=1 Tax=Nocardia sp. NPDC051570 TaxID=3364324 RepID=UPI00379665A4